MNRIFLTRKQRALWISLSRSHPVFHMGSRYSIVRKPAMVLGRIS